ncbi:dephospho-CoA kinase [Facklamia miroungae]|uniref:Dephospho-CoA kinase n=1 Tax=Facklamia miroungae TaxID=120956 RepID=A0A1G7TNA3_9LACT|nr:dephospho-CoA kinase [Facklamia miroungae]NKZ29785.1 dephospho-CoA kinase [Facklamia miroungae]SDG36169.1 dephospho-CoA kinase [Facklamia miroungae]
MTQLIALTGGIATGKSTVAHEIKMLGYPYIDTDQIARQVVEFGTEGLKKLVGRFSDKILLASGQLNRQLLASIVFNDSQSLKDLNQILHPLILDETKHQIEKFDDPFIFVEVPLLYEVGWQDFFDEVWVIYAPYSIQLERLMQRDQMDQETAQKKITSQIPTIEKVVQADRVIDTQFDRESVADQVSQALQALSNKL